MFDNFFNSIKNSTNNFNDNIKSKSKRFIQNFQSFKNRIVAKDKPSSYYTISPREDHDYFNNDYLSPRAFYEVTFDLNSSTVIENMEWVPYIPPKLDEHNIVDRFIKVITINDDTNRRTDREEIRRRLAMGAEEDYFSDRPGKKPSLQARLQSGMNLQICFMNENVSDTESPNSDSENPVTNSKEQKKSPQLKGPSTLLSNNNSSQAVRPATLAITETQTLSSPVSQESQSEGDFFTRQAKLQTEARMALAQAKEMARMQMELERQHQVKSPITEMVRNSLEKVGIPFPEEKRRLSRQILTEMNIAQLQVIVNDLHTQIETLNESLVKFLMERDDLHMEQDSMLVDIEDLTRYLGAKEQTLKEQNGLLASQGSRGASPPSPAPPSPPRSPLAALNSVKPHLHRIASFVKK